MTVTSRALFTSATVAGPLRIEAVLVEQKRFAANTAAATLDLPNGTLVAFNTSTSLWVPWSTAGANGAGTIRGIVWGPKPFTLFAGGGGETIIPVMVRGRAHFQDVSNVTGGTLANMVAAMRADPSAALNHPRLLGLDFTDLQLIN